ncbi:replication initiation protein RepC [Oleispirillum naphthae]|uniref:replication initiation protein RepC n=1 Tax=Oleispirillum naphthae TaxID=2838853 RepID=UPI003B677BE9
MDAARSLLPEIGIDASTWRYACEIIGLYPAALALLIADRAALDRGVLAPGAYLRGMSRRAIDADLALDRSMFGLVGG